MVGRVVTTCCENDPSRLGLLQLLHEFTQGGAGCQVRLTLNFHHWINLSLSMLGHQISSPPRLRFRRSQISLALPSNHQVPTFEFQAVLSRAHSIRSSHFTYWMPVVRLGHPWPSIVESFPRCPQSLRATFFPLAPQENLHCPIGLHD